MNRNELKDIVYIIVAILVSVAVIRLFIWLLPVILVALLAYYIYTILKGKDNKGRKTDHYNKNSNTSNKKKKIVIIDEEKDSEDGV